MRKRFFLASLSVFFFLKNYSQAVWQDVKLTNRSINESEISVEAGRYRLATIEPSALQKSLRLAPRLTTGAKASTGLSFRLPLPDGTSLALSVFEDPLWAEKDAAQFSHLKTYIAVDPVTASLQGRFTLTTDGITGLLFTEKGTVYINPLPALAAGMHLSYYTKDSKLNWPGCAAQGKEDEIKRTTTPLRTQNADNKKRVYRLAVATTAEYTTWAGSQANALTYLTIAINNVTAIYNRDLNVSFTIVSPPSIRFTNAATDPYPGGNVYLDDAATTANQTALDNTLGTANYDVGIVFNKGWDRGYVPYPVGTVCNASRKGLAAAGTSNGEGQNPTRGPQGYFFDFTVAHELGHAFGCHHSYASNTGFCTGFATPSAAFEPGSGSTLMGYAGYPTCNTYTFYGEPYFHAGSIDEAKAYMNSGGACTTPTTTANHPPVITPATATFNLPVSTPFTLSATGSDPDGNALLYNWEQMDAGFLTASPPAATNTGGPNFRSYAPTPNGNVRSFPKMADILAGTSPPYEVLPSVTRTMHFRLTARDNAAGGGAIGDANATLNFNSNAGPFKVTSQATAITWAPGSLQTINWNVANTTAAPVSCSTVNILFSVDGGFTFPYTLAFKTGNDGSETITVPNVSTGIGRVKVEAGNNIFFNVNAANITISSTCAANGAAIASADSLAAPAGSAALNLSLSPQYGAVFTPAGTITAANPSTLMTIYNSTTATCAFYSYNASFKYAMHNFEVASPGTYTFTPTNYGLIYNLYSDSFNPDFPCANFIASNTVASSSGTAIGPNVSATLYPGRKYVLVAGTYSTSFPTLPFNYLVNVSGGSIYTGPPNPGAGYNYYYVVVNDATTEIVAISPTANLSDAATFPGGKTYSVYGLSYSATSPPVSSLAGTSFSTLRDTLLTTYRCGNLSRNYKKLTVLAQYVFTGNGNWSNAANWSGGQKPPSPLPPYSQIIIDPAGSGECVLDVPVNLSGNKIIVASGKKFTVMGNLKME